MSISNEKRSELYKIAPEAMKALYGSIGLGDAFREIYETLEITKEEDQYVFGMIVGDIILGLHNKSSLGVILKEKLNFTDENVTLVESKLKPFLVLILETNSSPSVIQIPASEKSETSATEPPLDEGKHHSAVKPLRTFAMDVDISRAHSYGSFQSGETDVEKDDEPVHRSSQDDIIK